MKRLIAVAAGVLFVVAPAKAEGTHPDVPVSTANHDIRTSAGEACPRSSDASNRQMRSDSANAAQLPNANTTADPAGANHNGKLAKRVAHPVTCADRQQGPR